jgi:hypothetical protein
MCEADSILLTGQMSSTKGQSRKISLGFSPFWILTRIFKCEQARQRYNAETVEGSISGCQLTASKHGFIDGSLFRPPLSCDRVLLEGKRLGRAAKGKGRPGKLRLSAGPAWYLPACHLEEQAWKSAETPPPYAAPVCLFSQSPFGMRTLSFSR